MSLSPSESTYKASVDAEIWKNVREESLQKRRHEGLMNDRALLTPIRNKFQAAIMSDEDKWAIVPQRPLASTYKASVDAVEESLQNVMNETWKNKAAWDANEGNIRGFGLQTRLRQSARTSMDVDKGRRAREDEDEIRKGEILHKRPQRERLMSYHALLTSAWKEFEDTWASRNNVPATSEHTGRATLLIVKLLTSPWANVRQQMIQTLPMLECLINLNDDSILIDTYCVLSLLADDGTEDILPVDDGLYLHLLKLFGNRPSLHLPAFDYNKIFAEDDIPTQSLVDAKVIWSLLRLMKDSNSKLLEKEVLPILTNILIGPNDDNCLRMACWVLSYISDDIDDIQKILDADVCPHLVKLLRDSSDWVRYPALRTVSNIFAGYTVTNLSPPYNDPKIQTVIDANIIWKLISLMKDDTDRLETRLLDFLKKIINLTDKDVLRVACTALSYISAIIEVGIIDAAVCQRLVFLLGGSSDWVIYPALHIVSNICGAKCYGIETMIDAQALPALSDILKREYCWEYIKLQACVAITKIVSCENRTRHTKSVIDAGIVAPLIRLLENDALADRTRRQASYAIHYMTTSGVRISSLVKSGCIEAICKALSSPCIFVVDLCLQSLQNILERGELQIDSFDDILRGDDDGELQKKITLKKLTGNRYAKLMEKIKGFEKIEKVKDVFNKRTGIPHRAVSILETYCPVESANFSGISQRTVNILEEGEF